MLWRITKWVAGVVAVCFVLLALAYAWFVLTFVSREEIARVSSPISTEGQALEAVVIETNAGATTSFGYEVYVEAKPSWRHRREHVANVYGGNGIHVSFPSAHSLVVECADGQEPDLLRQHLEISAEGLDVSVAVRSFE